VTAKKSERHRSERDRDRSDKGRDKGGEEKGNEEDKKDVMQTVQGDFSLAPVEGSLPEVKVKQEPQETLPTQYL